MSMRALLGLLMLCMVSRSEPLRAQCTGAGGMWTLSTAGYDVFHQVVEHPNGDLYVLGFSDGFSSGHDLVLARYTPGLELVWAKRLDLSGDDGGSSATMMVGASGALYLGGTMSGLGNTSDGALVKMSADGDVLWARRVLPLPGYCQVRSIGETPEEDVVIVGSANSIGAGQVDAYAARFNSSGQLQWLRSYGWAGQDHFTDVHIEPGGAIMALSTSMGQTGSIRRGLMSWIGSMGSPSSTVLHGGGVFELYNRACRNTDGTYLCVGSTTSFGSGGTDVLVALTDPAGELIWSFAIGTAQAEVGLNAVQDEAGGWYVACHQGTVRAARIIHIGPLGQLLGVWGLDDMYFATHSSWNQPLMKRQNGTYMMALATMNGMDAALMALDQCAQSACGTTPLQWQRQPAPMTRTDVTFPITANSTLVDPVVPELTTVTTQFTANGEEEHCGQCGMQLALADTSICVGQVLVLEPAFVVEGAGGYDWEWTLGDGSSGPVTAVVAHTYAVPGTYTASVTVTDAEGCIASNGIEVQVLGPPFPDLGEDLTLCSGDSIELAVSAGQGGTFQWSDGSVGNVHVVHEAGLVWVQASAAGCSVSDSLTVVTMPMPEFDMLDTTICPGVAIELSTGLSGLHHLWQDGSTGSSVIVSTPGLYWVRVELDGCTVSDTTMVVAMDLPFVQLGPDTISCNGVPIVLQADTIGVGSLSWSDGGSGVSLLAASSGTYWVEMQNTCGSYRDYIQVQVIPPILPGLGPDTTLCEPFAFELSPLMLGDAVLWQDGSTGPVQVIHGPGLYSVTVTVAGCTGTDQLQVIGESIPLLSAPNDTLLCDPGVVVLEAISSGAGAPVWTSGHIGPQIEVGSTGTYVVMVENSCGMARDSVRVVYAPMFQHIGDMFVCPGGEALISMPSGTQHVLWSTGEESMTLSLPIGEYAYVAQDGAGCTRTGHFGISVDPSAAGVADVPNVFTPNGDGINDRFGVEGAQLDGYDLEVFDRWGRSMFKSDRSDRRWDGRLKGDAVPDGIYLYVLKYRDRCDGGAGITRTGHVTLLR